MGHVAEVGQRASLGKKLLRFGKHKRKQIRIAMMTQDSRLYLVTSSRVQPTEDSSQMSVTTEIVHSQLLSIRAHAEL